MFCLQIHSIQVIMKVELNRVLEDISIRRILLLIIIMVLAFSNVAMADTYTLAEVLPSIVAFTN